MPNRYTNVDIVNNNDERYKSFMRKRSDYLALEGGKQLKFIRHYATNQMQYPNNKQLGSLELISHIWSRGDRLTNLAHEHYGTPTLWWAIAFFNKKPTEFHFKFGDIVYIPHPIVNLLAIMGI